MQPESTSRWRSVGASVTGTSHLRTGGVCQDFHAWRDLGRAGRLAVVADGAGSARLGGVGAETAVRAACEALENSAPGTDGAELSDGAASAKARALACVEAARGALEASAAERGCPLRELACTLLLVVILDEHIGVAHVGDGAIVARQPGGGMFCLTTPSKAEYANETTFLTSDCFRDDLRAFATTEPLDALALFSDGLEQIALKLVRAEPHPAFFEPLWAFLANCGDSGAAQASLEQFLRHPRVTSRTDDDLTLVLVLRDDRVPAPTPHTASGKTAADV